MINKQFTLDKKEIGKIKKLSDNVKKLPKENQEVISGLIKTLVLQNEGTERKGS